MKQTWKKIARELGQDRGGGACNHFFKKACSGIPAPGIPSYWSILSSNIQHFATSVVHANQKDCKLVPSTHVM